MSKPTIAEERDRFIKASAEQARTIQEGTEGLHSTRDAHEDSQTLWAIARSLGISPPLMAAIGLYFSMWQGLAAGGVAVDQGVPLAEAHLRVHVTNTRFLADWLLALKMPNEEYPGQAGLFEDPED